MATGGGQTILNITSRWSGSARWARNAVHTTTDVEESTVRVTRMIRGSNASSTVNEFSDRTLRGAIARAEEETKWSAEEADQSPPFPEPPQAIHPYLKPVIWFEPTYNLAPDARIAAIVPLIEAARAAGFTIAGNLEVGGEGTSYVRNAPNPVLRYYPHTTVQVSMTVRDARNGGSGWAGLDHNDWSRIDVAALGRIAMHKCDASRHPVAVEPGRYTAILEPQAVGDLVMSIIGSLDRQMAESGMGPFEDT
jgi:predicted Zn-dependent protease